MTQRERYNPQAIESKWQARWDNDELYRSKVDWSKPKYYALTMLPYPSGDLHIGHWFAMTPSDARARFKRMQGFNVLFPMGFDAFGLPAENAAVQRGIHPAKWTHANMERMRKQLRSMGAMFDWEREAASCEPEYYKWTQWFFKKFYESGLAYRSEALVNWSPTLQTVLANEQVIDGKDERTGQPVIQKMLTQWFFRMTKYADELLLYTNIDWPEPIRMMQSNWIGRSEGARVVFHTETGNHPIEIFTTRPDTLWGATFMVLAPEHDLVKQIVPAEHQEAVQAYIDAAARQTELERTSDDRDKTGVFTGAYAINPVNGERIPIWIADYVLITYGTGAIMAVPAHDERDFAFARKYGLEIRPVIRPDDAGDDFCVDAAYSGAGQMINSGRFDGTFSNGDKGRKNGAISAVIDWISGQGYGREAINYRLRDWLISRQRYWGAPIPMVYRADGSVEPVADQDLPAQLPDDVVMSGIGNPLANHEGFVNAKDSNGQPARRETDTMDTFMCSSWYWFRYLSPKKSDAAFDAEEAAYWLPVDVYTGGAEHATMHLLYARFFTKSMRDLGMFEEAADIMQAHGRDPQAAFDEPFMLLRNQGQILGEEREGHYIRAHGQWDSNTKLFADQVNVISKEEALDVDPVALSHITGEFASVAEEQMSGSVMGEIVKRTENIVTVRDSKGELKTVEVRANAEINIPDIPGENTVNQLKHHLEIQRMSKSKGNVVNPDDWVNKVGADTVRAYLMFGFDWTKGGPWDSQGIEGPARWLRDVWDIVTAGAPANAQGEADAERALERRVHQTIYKVGTDLENFSFNTTVAALMTLKNDLKAALREPGKIGAAAWTDAVKTMLLLMAPITPHIAEELWERIGQPYSVHLQAFPIYDAAKAADDMTTLIVMKNGKPVDRVDVSANIGEQEAIDAAMETNGAKRALNGGQPKRVIFVPGRNEGQKSEPKVNIVV
ncbi:MAG: leucine--tRNA ligase [Anaerolineae bacterium]|nr:leucine--tRNA ligase [Anaerolineae bacterium]